MLRRMISNALLAGLIAGLLLTVVQRIQVIPLIQQAEVFEQQAAGNHQNGHSHDHDHAKNEATSWSPGNGLERTLYTLLANVLSGTGFALLLIAGMSLRKKVTWKTGVIWGIAGYLVFFVAPASGIPPKLPGIITAGLAESQIWWAATAATTAVGLACLAFGRSALLKSIGIVFLLMPHLVGAPQPPAVTNNPALQTLAQQFVIATTITNFIFWLALGSTAGWLVNKFQLIKPGLNTDQLSTSA